jgi:hypothetical protein
MAAVKQRCRSFSRMARCLGNQPTFPKNLDMEWNIVRTEGTILDPAIELTYPEGVWR